MRIIFLLLLTNVFAIAGCQKEGADSNGGNGGGNNGPTENTVQYSRVHIDRTFNDELDDVTLVTDQKQYNYSVDGRYAVKVWLDSTHNGNLVDTTQEVLEKQIQMMRFATTQDDIFYALDGNVKTKFIPTANADVFFVHLNGTTNFSDVEEIKNINKYVKSASTKQFQVK